jgi:hypothetical protein
MNRQEAITLLREALDRLERPSQNAHGGKIMMGGVYWRLDLVLRSYVDAELEKHEGAAHAATLRGTPIQSPSD